MTAIGTDPQLEAFIAAFDDFVRAAKRARARGEDDDTALTPAQADLLAPLADAGGTLGLRELARAAAVAPPTATRMVDTLVERGLMTRARCEDDRRAVRLEVTPAGTAAVAEHRRRMLARRRALFAQLEPSERDVAARVLARMAAAFEAVGR